MALRLFVSQRTNRHVVKRLNSSVTPATYDSAVFGEWQVLGVDNAHLNYPNGLAADASNNVYVCDTENSRIVKLNSSMAHVSSYDTSSTIGKPFAIVFYSTNGDLYVVGVKDNLYIRIERLTTAFVSVRASGNLTSAGMIYGSPTAIVNGFAAGDFYVAGFNNDIWKTTETTSFSTLINQTITGESARPYYGMVNHSDGYLYLNDGRQIKRVDNTFANNGDSDRIAKKISLLSVAVNGDLFIYNNDLQKISRYTNKLNFVADTYLDTGSTVALDAYDIMGIVEKNI